MSVLKTHWNNGVGNCLFEYLIKWVKDEGVIKKINLKVSVKNFNAIQLYKNFCFVKEGSITGHLFISNSYQDSL
jgi:RimJ/RimL family protein N-acetyltransferase